MKIFIFGLLIGIVCGLGGGFFTDGQFHPDFFVLTTLLSYVVLLFIEINKGKKKSNARITSRKVS